MRKSPLSGIPGAVRVCCTMALVLLALSAAWSFDVDCSSLAEWNPTSVYVGGDQVKYNGTMYQANYWTQRNNPEEYSDPYEHLDQPGTV